MTDEEKNRFYIAQQYLQVSKNLIDKMIEKENPYILISNHNKKESEFHEHIRHSSMFVILPTLFCLYQGIELLLKGFVYIKRSGYSTHKSEGLYDEFCSFYPNDTNLRHMFDKYINNPTSFIKKYKDINNISSVSELYNSFRYPDFKKKSYSYLDLKYQQKEAFLKQLKTISNDIDKILKYSVSIFRNIEQN